MKKPCLRNCRVTFKMYYTKKSVQNLEDEFNNGVVVDGDNF